MAPLMSAKKKISCFSCHTFDVQNTSDSTFLYQSVSLSSSSLRVLSPPSHSLPAPSSHSLLTFPASSLSFPIIITYSFHWIAYTELFKPLHSHFWWDALPCHDDPLTKKGHTELLDSSSWGQSMATPRWSLNSLVTTASSSTCSWHHLTGMTARCVHGITSNCGFYFWC